LPLLLGPRGGTAARTAERSGRSSHFASLLRDNDQPVQQPAIKLTQGQGGGVGNRRHLTKRSHRSTDPGKLRELRRILFSADHNHKKVHRHSHTRDTRTSGEHDPRPPEHTHTHTRDTRTSGEHGPRPPKHSYRLDTRAQERTDFQSGHKGTRSLLLVEQKKPAPPRRTLLSARGWLYKIISRHNSPDLGRGEREQKKERKHASLLPWATSRQFRSRDSSGVQVPNYTNYQEI